MWSHRVAPNLNQHQDGVDREMQQRQPSLVAGGHHSNPRGKGQLCRCTAVSMGCAFLLLLSAVGKSIYCGDINEHVSVPPLPRPNLRSLSSSSQLGSRKGTSLTDTGNGYDTAHGVDALCWKGLSAKNKKESDSTSNSSTISSPFEDFHLLGPTSLLPDCSSQQLQAFPPVELTRGDVLRTGIAYNFTVKLSTDLSQLLNEKNETEDKKHSFWRKDYSGKPVVATVKIVLCDVNQAGFCTPFFDEQERMTQKPQSSAEDAMDELAHLDSQQTLLNLEDYSSLGTLDLQANITISMTIQHPGEFVAIAAVEMYTHESSSNASYYRWDIANAARDVDGDRLLQIFEPTTILEVSSQVELVSYIAIGLASFMVALFLLATIYYRNSQIMKLTQGNFLIAYLSCALVAVTSSFLLNPKSDAYCRYSYPIILISLQIMYAITAGRLWRIHAILSPILKHRDTDNMNESSTNRSRNGRTKNKISDRVLRNCLQALRRIPGAGCIDSVKCKPAEAGLKRKIPNSHLTLMIGICSMPQILVQITSLVLQPQVLTVDYSDDGSIGHVYCDVADGSEGKVNLMVISFVVFVIFLFLLLAVAFYSRKLPSVGVLNETRQIYDTTLTTMILLVLAVGIVLLTSNARTSPDVAYLVWVTVVIWSTLNSAIRVMFPKLKMAVCGETVIVSALVKEHHQKIRDKEEAKLKVLTAKAHAFQRCVNPLVKDRDQNAEFVKQCFAGEEAIDALVENKVVASRWEGIQLGRLLEREMKLFRIVGGSKEQEFQDGQFLYSFQDFAERTGSSFIPRFSTMQHLQKSITASATRPPEDATMKNSVANLSRGELKELAAGFRAYLDLRDRKYKMRTFHHCFVASESIDSMMYAGLANSREEAVQLGLVFQKELNLFRHVTNEHQFCDEVRSDWRD